MGREYADLQLHTVASDGTDTVAERVVDAQRHGLDAIAITDHDTISDDLSGRVSVRDGVEVITGAEIKCEAWYDDAADAVGIEVLGYFLDPAGQQLQDLLDEVSAKRVDRIDTFVANLNDHHNEVDLSTDDVLAYADGNVGRPHLAQALMEQGLVDSMDAAFDQYIGDDDPAYVPTEKVPARDVIQAIHDNGGYASLAHPGRDLERGTAAAVVQHLAGNGLDALEVPYTYEDKRDREPFTVNFGSAYAAELADRCDLAWTGGSDCHGRDSDKYYIGDVKLPYRHVETMKAHIGLT